jgi:hypothetical protein
MPYLVFAGFTKEDLIEPFVSRHQRLDIKWQKVRITPTTKNFTIHFTDKRGCCGLTYNGYKISRLYFSRIIDKGLR